MRVGQASGPQQKDREEQYYLRVRAIPSAHLRWLTTAWNSRSKRSNECPLWLLPASTHMWHTLAQICKHVHINKNKPFKLRKGLWAVWKKGGYCFGVLLGWGVRGSNSSKFHLQLSRYRKGLSGLPRPFFVLLQNRN